MKIREVHIRHWDIVFLFSFDTDDLESILDALLGADAPDSIIQHVSENVLAGEWDEGFTFSNPSLRRTVFAASEATSGPEMMDTVVHEIIHICQHIALEDGINPFSEKFAYLGGDISRTVSDVVCVLSCPHCSGA